MNLLSLWYEPVFIDSIAKKENWIVNNLLFSETNLNEIVDIVNKAAFSNQWGVLSSLQDTEARQKKLVRGVRWDPGQGEARQRRGQIARGKANWRTTISADNL